MHGHSQPDSVLLTERSSALVRLAPADVAYLLEHHRRYLEILPTGRRNRYRLTARGCAGVVMAPTCRLVIRPKIPLVNLFALLDPFTDMPAPSDSVQARTGLETLEFLTGQLCRRLSELAAAGLHRTYQERQARGSMLHGRLDLPAQMRQAPGRREQLHGRFEELSPDLPINQAIKATVDRLLLSPLLNSDLRGLLRQAVAGFEGVTSVTLSTSFWQQISSERIPERYGTLLDLCRLLADGLTMGKTPGDLPAPSFLINLEHVFERHVVQGIAASLTGNSALQVVIQKERIVTEAALPQDQITIRPDLTIDGESRTRVVVDAKWKRWAGRAETEDLYQVLAYGMTLAAQLVVLVYPGKRWRWLDARFAHTPLRLSLCTLPVRGTREECLRGVGRLARALQKHCM